MIGGQCAQLACVWEVTARKAGNVHPGRDFPNLRFTDFLASAAAIAPAFDRAERQSVGQTVLDAIRATRGVVSTNTNLGMVLLLAPLAAVPGSRPLRAGLLSVLSALTVDDARQVYAAIRLAVPGGLGQAPTEDIAKEPTVPLRQAMALAADRDLVARQYVRDYEDVFDLGIPILLDGLSRHGDLETAIILAHLGILAKHPDSLIARKRGPEEAGEARRLAVGVLEAGWPSTAAGQAAFAAFDAWLTAVGNARNPGTSADLVAACLFVALREKWIGASAMSAPRQQFNQETRPSPALE
jgi:triphosphoribosyl-dephospho-CoA synthase